jgi:hypothetical protein
MLGRVRMVGRAAGEWLSVTCRAGYVGVISPRKSDYSHEIVIADMKK